MKSIHVLKYNYILIFALLIYGCSTRVYFESPQPEKGMILKKIPGDITGVYSDSTFSISIARESLFISGRSFQLTRKNPEKNQVQLRFYNPYYFAIFKESSYYDIFMGYFYDNKLAVYMLNSDQHSTEMLNRAVKVDTLDHEKEIYLIDPSTREFDAMLEWDVWDVITVLSKK